MLLEEIKDVLEAAGVYVFGADLFFAGFPATAPPDALSLFGYPGESPETVKGRASPVLEYPRFQVVSRSKRYPVAVAKAEEAHAALEGFSSELFAWIRSPQSGFTEDRDSEGRPLIRRNYEAARGG